MCVPLGTRHDNKINRTLQMSFFFFRPKEKEQKIHTYLTIRQKYTTYIKICQIDSITKQLKTFYKKITIKIVETKKKT